MLEILFVTLYRSKWNRNLHTVGDKYKLSFKNEELKKQFIDYDNETKNVVLQIWKEILKQTPNDEFVKKIEKIVDSHQSYDPKDLYDNSIEVFISEGSREFIDLIAE